MKQSTQTFMILPAVIFGVLALFAATHWPRSDSDRIYAACFKTIDAWKGAWAAEHDAMLAWRGASDAQQKAIGAQGRLILAQGQLLELRAEYIQGLEQALQQRNSSVQFSTASSTLTEYGSSPTLPDRSAGSVILFRRAEPRK